MSVVRITGQHRCARPHQGWLLPDALIALSIVALTLVMTQQSLMAVRSLEHQNQVQLERARGRRDAALLAVEFP